MEYAKYLSVAYGLYREDTLDLIAESAVPYDSIPTMAMPRELANYDDLVELITEERHYTMNRFGVVVDCYNTGDIDQVIMVEHEGFLIWKIHFKKPGWILDGKGELISDLRGAEYFGYFNPDFMPRSLFTAHTDFLEFEYQVYNFVLECYADIVCGSDAVNKRFGRSAVNMATVLDNPVLAEGDVVGFRYTPRTVHAAAKKKAANQEEFEDEIKKYFISGHIRKLPEGHNASQEALALAAEFGIDLPRGHTFVRPYESGEEKIRTRYVKRL
jgi:hypothetical protein